MFTKRSIATMAVIAGVLAAAGPASASSIPLENTMISGVHSKFMDYTDDVPLKNETEVTDYVKRKPADAMFVPDVQDEVL
jgi:hypothetical protein